jgi:hypothetical protein
VTAKKYSGIVTDAYGVRWGLTYLFTNEEYAAALKAGIIPEDTSLILDEIEISDEEVWRIAAQQVITRCKSNNEI